MRYVQGDACVPRRHITGINYSKKTISVEFKYRSPSDAFDSDSARPPDGKSLLNKRPTLAAPRAAPLESLSARTSESGPCISVRTTKKPGRLSRPDLNGVFVSLHSGGVCSVGPKIDDAPDLNPQILVTFPNIAHKFWDAYRQGGGVHLRRSRAQILAM